MSSVLRLTSEQTLDYSSSQAINFLDLEAPVRRLGLPRLRPDSRPGPRSVRCLHDLRGVSGMVPHVRRTMRQLIAACTRQISDADLQRIDVPTVLVWGRADRMV